MTLKLYLFIGLLGIMSLAFSLEKNDTTDSITYASGTFAQGRTCPAALAGEEEPTYRRLLRIRGAAGT